MADLSFLYIAFFLTIGSFLLGFVSSWNLKSTYDEWKERAEYAAVVMHPEMMGEDGMADPALGPKNSQTLKVPCFTFTNASRSSHIQCRTLPYAPLNLTHSTLPSSPKVIV